MTAGPWQRTGVCSAGPHTAQRPVGRWSNVSCEGCWICPIPAARPPAGWLLLWCLQHPGSGLAPGALSSAGERSRASSAVSQRMPGLRPAAPLSPAASRREVSAFLACRAQGPRGAALLRGSPSHFPDDQRTYGDFHTAGMLTAATEMRCPFPWHRRLPPRYTRQRGAPRVSR
jgi:hypothetical protein